MAYTVRDLGTLIPTSSGATVSNQIGHLDDAASIMIYFTSSAGGGSTGTNVIQVSQFDPADVFPQFGAVQSSQFFPYTVQTSLLTPITPGSAVTLTAICFRGIRLGNITSYTSGEIIAYVSKQITVAVPLLLVPTLAAISRLF